MFWHVLAWPNIYLWFSFAKKRPAITNTTVLLLMLLTDQIAMIHDPG
jgi:hypothetical protein